MAYNTHNMWLELAFFFAQIRNNGCMSCLRNAMESKTALSRDTCHVERAATSQWFVSVSFQK